jgi:hypothetical protein
MTLFANLGPRLGSLFAQRGVQAIVAGVLSGVVGGSALVATGVIPTGGTRQAPDLALMACPGSGPVLAHVPTGKTLLVTARSGDGAWLEVYIGEPGIDRAWAPVSALKLQSAADALPVDDCAAASTLQPLGTPTPTVTAVVVTPSPEPSLAPNATPTLAPSATPRPTASLKVTPKPTGTPHPTPTATPVPTPTPDTTGPTISNLTITGAVACGDIPSQYCIFVTVCPPPNAATISIDATDPSGVIDANLWYRLGSSGGYSAVGLNHSGDTWSGTISAGSSGGQVEYFWEAFDSFGNQSNLNNTSDRILRIDGCIL